MKILRVSTVVQHFHAQFLLPRAAAVGRPIAAEIAHLAGSRELGQLGQCSAKNGYIALPVVWWPKGAADGMIDKYGTRRRDSAHDVVRRANDEGRNSLALDHVGDETDGLVAEGSVGYEQHEIDLVALQSQRRARKDDLGILLGNSTDT